MGGRSSPAALPRHDEDSDAGSCVQEPCRSQPLHAERGRQRDLLPLPLPGVLVKDVDRWDPLSRGTRRRLVRASTMRQLEYDAVNALNEMYAGRATPPGPPRPSAAQEQALALIRAAVQRLGPPPGPIQLLVALAELQAFPAYDASPSVRAEPLDLSRLSLPPPGSTPVALEELLDADGGRLVRRFLSNKGLPKDEASRRREAAGFKKPYLDPALRDPRRYAKLVSMLVASGVVDLTADPGEVLEQIGLFAVPKKSGRQRLVLDARPANFMSSLQQ